MTEFLIEGDLDRDLSTVCRICLKNDGTVSIFSEKVSDNEYTLQERIMSFAYVEIFEGDGFPSHICKKCFIRVNTAFKLKAQCEYADFFLRQHLVTSKEAREEVQDEVTEDDLEELVTEDIVDELVAINVIELAAEDVTEELTPEGTLEETAANHPVASDKTTLKSLPFPTESKNIELEHKEIKVRGFSAKNNSQGATNSSKTTETVHVGTGIDNTIVINGRVPVIILNADDVNDQVIQQSNAIFSERNREDARPRKRENSPIQTEVHKCSLCDEQFPLEGRLINHILKNHEPSGEFPCIECGRTFPQQILLDLHVKKHTAERPYCCNICGKHFMRFGTLTSHKRSHSNKGFLCNHCGKLFSSKKLHICPVVNGNREKTHACNICGKKFIRQSTLTTHKKRHRLVERFRCKICSKPFYSSQELERHVNVHMGIRPFACNFQDCGHTFYTKGELNRHLRYHKGEKKHKCDECGLAFYESGHLVNHKRKHTGERPYICELCSKSFTDASKLKRHVNTHSDTGTSSRRASKTAADTQAASDKRLKTAKTSWAILEGERLDLSCTDDSDD